MEFRESKTFSNLIEIYKGSAISMQRYELYKVQASNEGFHQIENIYSEVISNEKTISNIWYKYLNLISSTKENLDISLKEIQLEIDDLSNYSEIAVEEGYNKVALQLRELIEIKKSHMDVIGILHRNIINNEMFSKKKEVDWKCSKCGYIFHGFDACSKCLMCQAEQGYFYHYTKIV